MFFLPQRPYCTLGPLRDQITYPSSQSDQAASSSVSETGDVATLKEGLDHDATAEKGASEARNEDDLLLGLLEKVRMQK